MPVRNITVLIIRLATYRLAIHMLYADDDDSRILDDPDCEDYYEEDC